MFVLYKICSCFFNNVNFIVCFLIYKTGYYVVGMFSKYLSSEQALKDRKDCARLNYVLRHPHPNFGIEGNYLFYI